MPMPIPDINYERLQSVTRDLARLLHVALPENPYERDQRMHWRVGAIKNASMVRDGLKPIKDFDINQI